MGPLGDQSLIVKQQDQIGIPYGADPLRDDEVVRSSIKVSNACWILYSVSASTDEVLSAIHAGLARAGIAQPAASPVLLDAEAPDATTTSPRPGTSGAALATGTAAASVVTNRDPSEDSTPESSK